MNESSFAGARVLVTGASGFIGSHLAARLTSLGAEVRGTTRSTIGFAPFRFQKLALEDHEGLRQLVAELQPQIVFHLAARMERDRRLDLLVPMLLANTLSTAVLCESLPPGARLVILGSGEDYGAQPGPWVETQREQPISPYGLSKVAAAAVVASAHTAFGVRAVTARPSVVYGPGQRAGQFLPSLISALIAGERFAMTPGEQLRDFLYIDDLVDGLLALASGEQFGRVFNLCSGISTRIVDLAKKAQALIGKGSLGIGDLPYRASEAMVQMIDPSAMKQAFGWEAKITLDEGLRRTIL
jgi:UDP-glucose 4-epimerase